MSPADPPAYEAPKAQQEEPVIVDHVPDSFSRSPLGTSLPM